MGVKKCIIKNCGTKGQSKGEFSFHEFLTKFERREAWIRLIEDPHLGPGYRDDYNPSDYSVICSKHFDREEDYQGGSNRLKNSAVPRFIASAIVSSPERKRARTAGVFSINLFSNLQLSLSK